MFFNSSKGLYHLGLKKIEIDVTNLTITVNDLHLTPDSLGMSKLEKSGMLTDNIYTVSLKQLYIKGLSPLDLLNGKKIDIKTIILDSPEIFINHKKKNFKVSQKTNLYEGITRNNQSWKIGDMLLKNITNQGKNNLTTTFKNLTASFTDILIDSFTKNDTSRFLFVDTGSWYPPFCFIVTRMQILFAKESSIFLKGYETTTANKLYKFSIDSIRLKPQEGNFEAFELRLKPFGSKETFNSKLPYSKDRCDLYVRNLKMKKTKWWGLLAGENFISAEVLISGAIVDIFKDKRPPSRKRTHLSRYPHQLLMDMDLPVFVNRVIISDSKVTYGEFDPKSGQAGNIAFNKVNGVIENITNIPEIITHSKPMRVTAESRLMNDGQLKVYISFDLKKVKNGQFAVDMDLASMDGRNLNIAAVGMGLLKFKELQIDQLKAHIDGTNTGTRGKVLFAYHDLNIEVLDKEAGGKIKKRGLKLFITNNFVIKKSNPQKKGEIATGKIVSFERGLQRSFFSVIWQTLLQGMMVQTGKGK